MSQAREPVLPGMRLTTYLELETIVQAFARGHLKLLILIGGHGLGKSRSVRRALAGRACWLEGNLSVFGLYCQLWEHRHLPVVLDAVDGLYAQRDGVRLLKCLTQSERLKSVSWHADAPTLQRQGIPQEFRTRSRVAIIANEWKTLNRNVAALQDRGHLLFFEPSPLEVHRRTATWFWDQEIFDFVQARLHWLEEASMRHYPAAGMASSERTRLCRMAAQEFRQGGPKVYPDPERVSPSAFRYAPRPGRYQGRVPTPCAASLSGHKVSTGTLYILVVPRSGPFL